MDIAGSVGGDLEQEPAAGAEPWGVAAALTRELTGGVPFDRSDSAAAGTSDDEGLVGCVVSGGHRLVQREEHDVARSHRRDRDAREPVHSAVRKRFDAIEVALAAAHQTTFITVGLAPLRAAESTADVMARADADLAIRRSRPDTPHSAPRRQHQHRPPPD
ncbi:hypothetical protein NBH00_12840 [Paraconexibacter antarcticus]|uniref:Uncharacterized protein n=1 Tax=Paraconexibacter antarcticus TaxID=2949664 RepID=A0ABY5DKL7_9ACTN|nr:hypothetical protein [Paraconexibacter antarcticus]UTI62255.1 hypothetical protein NBH00_12840 [Paraconexibacter antarcticus]